MAKSHTYGMLSFEDRQPAHTFWIRYLQTQSLIYLRTNKSIQFAV